MTTSILMVFRLQDWWDLHPGGQSIERWGVGWEASGCRDYPEGLVLWTKVHGLKVLTVVFPNSLMG